MKNIHALFTYLLYSVVCLFVTHDYSQDRSCSLHVIPMVISNTSSLKGLELPGSYKKNKHTFIVSSLVVIIVALCQL